MPIQKRCLLWDWTNTAHCPQILDSIPFTGPIHSVANWNTWVPPELKSRAPFRPTVRTPAQLDGGEWSNLLANIPPRSSGANAATATMVHFFNEPERGGVTVDDAVKAWDTQMIPLRTEQKGNVRLVGPSCASDDPGAAWLDAFMSKITTAPDLLGLHYYGTDASAAISYITSRHEKYPNLPIVVSEIASISRDPNEVLKFTADVANWMDGTAWVEEYAFFGCMRELADGFVSPAARLMEGDGRLTPLMKRLMTEQPIKV